MFNGCREILGFIGFLGGRSRIYTLFTPLEDRIGIVEIIIDKGVGENPTLFAYNHTI